MRNSLIALTAVVAGYAFSPSSHAAGVYDDDGVYFGLGVGLANFDNSMIGDSHDVLVGGVLGYQFWDYLAAEIRGYGGTTDDEVQVKYHYSALVRVIWPATPAIKPYLILGYGNTEANYISNTESDSDFVYGLGVSFRNQTPFIFALEWQSLYDEENNGVSVDGYMINTNVYYKF